MKNKKSMITGQASLLALMVIILLIFLYSILNSSDKINDNFDKTEDTICKKTKGYGLGFGKKTEKCEKYLSTNSNLLGDPSLEISLKKQDELKEIKKKQKEEYNEFENFLNLKKNIFQIKEFMKDRKISFEKLLLIHDKEIKIKDILKKIKQQHNITYEKEKEKRKKKNYFKYNKGDLKKVGGFSFTKSCKHTKRIKYKDELEEEFLSKLENIAKKYTGVGLNDFLKVMYFESAGTFSPCIVNGIGATGLIQFTKSTSKGLGITVKEMAKLSRIEQLDYVDKYLSPYKNKIKSLSDLYLAIFLPSMIGKNEKENIKQKYYKNNEGLDRDNNKKITVSEITYKVRNTPVIS